MSGPQLQFSDQLHGEKYREEGEDFREAMNRIAFALKGDDEHFKKFRSIILGLYFLPAGRVQLASGSSRLVTSSNCFVSGIIEDSFAVASSNVPALEVTTNVSAVAAIVANYRMVPVISPVRIWPQI